MAAAFGAASSPQQTLLRAAWAQDPAPAPSELEALRTEVEGLRADMQKAYAALVRDHALVANGSFAKHPGKATVAVVEAVSKAARDAGTTKIEDVVAAALSAYTVQDGDLSHVSLQLLLAQVAAAARNDLTADTTTLLASAVKSVLGFATVESAWDGPFQQLTAVRAFRAAQSRLADAEKAERERAAAVAPGAAGRESDMALMKRGRGHVGPWSGWVQVFKDKTNKRQPATRKPIYVDRYEVTCVQYAVFVNAQKSSKRAALLPKGWTVGPDGMAQFPTGKDRHPVTSVTYAQAVGYARHWGKRLPSESEWELIAAGMEKVGRPYPWGAEVGERKLGTRSAAKKVTAPVDAFPDDTTPEGVVGLAGNVAEYVATLPNRTDLPRLREPKGSEVIIRGGSFRSAVAEAKTTYRWIVDPTEGAAHVGFRCVMDALDYKRRFEK